MSTTTHPHSDTGRTHDDLVDQLVATRAIRHPAWEAAFRATPRHRFLHDIPTSTSPDRLRNHRLVTDPTAEHLAQTDSELGTGLDTAHRPAHACQQPSVLARMLEALDLHQRHRVLHIGDDTRYATALLRHRLHIDNSATPILRPSQPKHPTTNHEFEHDHLVVVRDSTAIPVDATFDRLIATSSVPRIPPTWIHHTRSGGVIVANIGYGLARLTVTTPGTATGHFLRTTTHLLSSTTTDGGTTQHDRRSLPPRHTDAVASGRPPHNPLRADVDALLRSLAGPEHEQLVNTSTTLHTTIAQLDPRWARPLPVEPQDFGLTVTSDGQHTVWLGPHRQPVFNLN